MWEIIYKFLFCLYVISLIGLRCLFGLVVLSFFLMVNMYLFGNVCMREVFSFVKVWYCCLVRR